MIEPRHTDIARARQLLLRTQPIVDRHIRHARSRGEQFNVFEILDRATDEVKGHSAFIAELLNPNGSHGQGTMFLKLFLEGVPGMDPEAVRRCGEDQNGRSWSVRTEFSFRTPGVQGGEDKDSRIDITIEGPDCFIVIENKINAEDVERQLERYHTFAQGKERLHVAVLYLTLDECDPSKYSLGELEPDKVTGLTYAKDITEWLDDCVGAAALLPNVRETISQYRGLVRRLVRGSLNKEMTMEIADQITDPDTFRTAREIAAAVKEVKVRTLTSFFKKLEDRLIDQVKQPELDRNSFPLWDLYPEEERVHDYYFKRKYRSTGLGFPLVNLDSELQVAFVVEVHWNLYYGVRLVTAQDEKPIPKAKAPERCEELLRTMQSIHRDFACDPGDSSLIAWRYPDCYPRKEMNWRDFDGSCVKLVDKRRLQKFVNELTGEIVSVLDKIKKHHELIS